MENKKTKMAIVGMTNTTTMNISKGITFVGAIISMIGVGGMLLSRKCFTETELDYLMKQYQKK